MNNTPPRCFCCGKPLAPRDEHATVELNPTGAGAAGFHRGHLCPDCESEVAAGMKKTTGGNV